MINRTQISVDDATRDILAELSAHMDREPAWASLLRDSVEDSFCETLAEEIIPVKNSLDQISPTVEITRRQVSHSVEVLNDQQHALQYLMTEAQYNKTTINDIIYLLQNITISLTDIGNKLTIQQTALTSFEQDIHQIHSELAQIKVATHRSLQETLILLKNLQSELASHRKELTFTQNRVEILSLPWWRKIFKRRKNRSHDE